MNNLKLININKYINKYNIIKLFIIIYLLLLLILLLKKGFGPPPISIIYISIIYISIIYGRGPSLLRGPRRGGDLFLYYYFSLIYIYIYNI